jgi:deazaflavin-dependent oxidoreductase (nitroreductase family)
MKPGVERRQSAVDRLRFVRRLMRGVEAAQVKRFGRSVLSLMFRTPVLVLATTGRRSGRRRETTLAYLREDDDRLLVVGGAGGQTRVPDWVANLRADPAVTVTVDRQRRPMRATELEGAERAIAWRRAVTEWPRIAKYESRAGRPVPVVRLAPRHS